MRNFLFIEKFFGRAVHIKNATIAVMVPAPGRSSAKIYHKMVTLNYRIQCPALVVLFCLYFTLQLTK